MISDRRVALNAIPWFNLPRDPSDPTSTDRWLLSEPGFREDYPGVLAEIRRAGFDTVMLEVLPVQTLQDYQRMLAAAGLRPAPGYAVARLPEDHGLTLRPGSPEWTRWFDGIRRKAEETNFVGLSTVFLAPELVWAPHVTRTARSAAVGADFSADRLHRVTEVIAEAADILLREGVRAGLHNHVGTWIETEAEIEHVLGELSPSLLGASFDIGHLAWAGIDPADMIARHAARVVDLHLKDIDVDLARDSRLHPVSYDTTMERGLVREPGLGGLDLLRILDALPPSFDGWTIIEVDRPTVSPPESARLSHSWVVENLASGESATSSRHPAALPD